MLSAVAACLLTPAPVVSQSDAVDALVQRQLEGLRLPGLSVAVVRNGEVVLAKGYGRANLEHSVPASEHTVYQLASVTKQFTATALMILVRDGKVSLEDPVTHLLDDLPSAWDGVTVRHLLNHTSGIPSYTGLSGFTRTVRTDMTPGEIVALVADLPLEFEPGTDWRYNNTGYVLLGMIIERVGGRPYGEFLEDRIFRPLGMTTARVNDLREIIPNRAQGYARGENGAFRIGEYVSPTQPFSAGALVGTVLDLAAWDAALDGESLLDRETLAMMWTPTRLADGSTRPYGFGWQVDEYRTRRRISHGGGIQGFNTFVARFPDDRTSVIVLINQEGVNPDQIANSIAALYIPELTAHAPQPIPDGEPQTTTFLKEVLVAIAKGAADPEWFTAEARAFLFPDRIREGAQRLGSLGELRSFELMEERTEETVRVRAYRADFGPMSLRVTYSLTEDGRIAGIGLRPEG